MDTEYEHQKLEDNELEMGQVGEAGPATEFSTRAWVISFSFATLATLIKTVAWWFNQWPFMLVQVFMVKWACSASIAGMEYAPMTFAMGHASSHGVPLSLMTAYMEAMDNLLRMIQQAALRLELRWFDWFVALLLGLCVVFQGAYHFRHERALLTDKALAAREQAPSTSVKKRLMYAGGAFLFIGLPSLLTLVFLGGWTGKAFALATVATFAKTFAWWINQYPKIKHRHFVIRWMAGWSIAAIIEYFPLIGTMTVASQNHVHLGLLTAYMEALDNFCRMLQMRLLNHPLHWFDWVAAVGMMVAVAFQGLMRFLYIEEYA